MVLHLLNEYLDDIASIASVTSVAIIATFLDRCFFIMIPPY